MAVDISEHCIRRMQERLNYVISGDKMVDDAVKEAIKAYIESNLIDEVKLREVIEPYIGPAIEEAKKKVADLVAKEVERIVDDRFNW